MTVRHKLSSLKESSSAVDRGYSWVILLSCVIVAASTWGVQLSMGIFYSEWIHQFQASKSLTAGITTGPLFMLYLFSPLMNVIHSKLGGFRLVAFIGSILMMTSLFASSFVNNIYLLLITYTLFMGCGLVLTGAPIILVVVPYFEKHLSLASGITTAGSFSMAMGLSPVLSWLISEYGWQIALRSLSLFVGSTCMFATLLWRPHVNESEKEPEGVTAESLTLIKTDRSSIDSGETTHCCQSVTDFKWPLSHREDLQMKDVALDQNNNVLLPSKKANMFRDIINSYSSLLKERKYQIWMLANMVISIEASVSITHLVQYTVELGTSRGRANLIPSVFAGGNILGRLLLSKLFDHMLIKKLTLLQILMMMSGSFALIGSLFTCYWQIILYACVFSILDGGYKCQVPVITQQIVGSHRFVSGHSLLMFGQSVTFLIGPPLVGYASEVANDNKMLFYFTAGPILLCATILLLLQRIESKEKQLAGEVVDKSATMENCFQYVTNL